MMARRLIEAEQALGPDAAPEAPPPVTDLVLRSAPNWTILLLCAGMAGLHLCNAVPAFLKGRYEGYLSMVFAAVFIAAALVCWRTVSEIAVLKGERRIRIRTGCGRVRIQRYVPFRQVHGVRLTFQSGAAPTSARLEVLCENEDLECPPT